MKDLKEFIKEKLKEEKLFIFGFTDPKVEERDIFSFKEWIKNKYHADMKWMENTFEKRISPLKVFETVKTILVVALPYKKIFFEKYKIAGYALHVDYHKFLYKKLKRVMEKVKEKFLGVEYKIYVDTGPILERMFARKAGIGFIGKNTMLISFKKGSYLLLGTVLLNKEIEPDKSIDKNFCGKCTRCIEACPTGAIVKPFVIDSNRCISYHTIENKGDIPEEIKLRMNSYIFGCDICQEVCPWNKNPVEPVDFPLHPYVKNFDPEDFQKNPEKYLKNSPLKRAKIKGLIRNINLVKYQEV
ncbi:MAG: tRNA epoxyqueuosine(34) reductase QueG [candidate division WOR-3 bacterium]